MLKIVFNNKKETQASFKNIKNGVVQLVGKNVNNLNGFKAYNSNDKFLGDYSEYTTKYNIYTEIEDGIMLSTGEVEPKPYVPPIVPPQTEATISFYVDSDVAKLVGETQVIVDIGSDLSNLELPEVVITDPTYEFLGWSQELVGEATNDQHIVANVSKQYIYTIEGRLEDVEQLAIDNRILIEGR